MRPKGIILLFSIIGLVLIVAYLLSDNLIESGLEKAGESMVGAKVEIDDLNFSLLGLSISLGRLQVTNPNDTWKNLFETGRMSFDMELAPLARKKIIINDVTVADIRIGTRRATDGKIPKQETKETPGWVGKAKKSLKKRVQSIPILNPGILKKKINVDSLFAIVDIHSPERLKSIKQVADSTHQKWQKIIKEFNPKTELDKIETQVNEIKTAEIKGLKDLVNTLDKSKRIYKQLNDFKKDIEQKKKQSSEDFNQLTNMFKQVDNWIAEDFDALKSKANLGYFTPQNIGNLVFGQNLTQKVLALLSYIDLARKYMPVAQQFMSAGKVENPPRFEGQNIRFPLRHPLPDFLIENIFLSGATNQIDTSEVFYLSGNIKGISSHPQIYGKPMTFDLTADLPQSNAYQISGAFDHTNDIPEEKIELKATGIRVGKIALPARSFLPSEMNVSSGNVAANFNLKGSELDFSLNFSAQPVHFKFPDNSANSEIMSKVTREVFNSVDLLKLSAGIHGSLDNLDLKINTNIDNLLANRIRGVIGKSAEMARSEIQQKLNALVEPEKQEAQAVVNKYQNQIKVEINKIENGINKKLAVVDQKKKELEKKIKEEKEKGIKDVKKKLKNIFKKN